MDEHQSVKKGMNWTLIIIALILAFGFIGYRYTESIKMQNQIEKEKNEANERIRLQELSQNQAIANEKLEQDKKEFVAKRKTDCMSIYKTEGAKWNNVNGWRYSDTDDTCYVQYKDKTPKTEAECDEYFPTKDEAGKSLFYNLRSNLLCKDGNFENSF